MQVRSRVKLCTTWSVFLLLWYQILMMQPWVFCWNTGVVSYSRGPDHPEPTPWPWAHHPLLGGPVCGSWKSRLLGDTTSHSHAAPVLRGLVQLYNKEEGVSCKHALSLLGSVSNADWHTHTNTASRLVRAGCGQSGVFMTWHHRTGWWSAVSCFVWFSSINCSSTNTRSGKTCQEGLWLVRRSAHELSITLSARQC